MAPGPWFCSQGQNDKQLTRNPGVAFLVTGFVRGRGHSDYWVSSFVGGGVGVGLQSEVMHENDIVKLMEYVRDFPHKLPNCNSNHPNLKWFSLSSINLSIAPFKRPTSCQRLFTFSWAFSVLCHLFNLNLKLFYLRENDMHTHHLILFALTKWYIASKLRL